MRCPYPRTLFKLPHWSAIAAAVSSSLAIAAGVWLSTVPAAPRIPEPVNEQAELLADVVTFVESPAYQAKLLADERAALAAERDRLEAEKRVSEIEQKNIAIESSYRDVEQIVPVRVGQELLADGDATNTVIVTCEETDLGWTVLQKSRGLLLEGRNAATCTPGTYQGGEAIATTGNLSLGWTVEQLK